MFNLGRGKKAKEYTIENHEICKTQNIPPSAVLNITCWCSSESEWNVQRRRRTKLNKITYYNLSLMKETKELILP